MFEVEVSLNEFEDLHLHSDRDIYMFLHRHYFNACCDALNDLVEDECVGFDEYIQLFNIFEFSELIDYTDEYIDEEVLVNYFVRDGVGTDYGTWEMIVENGYQVLDCPVKTHLHY